MDIKDFKAIVKRVVTESKVMIFEYIITKRVLIFAIISIPLSVFLIVTAQPNFVVSSTIHPTDTDPISNSKVQGLLAFTTAANAGISQNTKFLLSLRSSDTAEEMWDRWGLRLFNADPKNSDVSKMPQEHSFIARLGSWIGGYELPKYKTYFDLQDYIQNVVQTKVDFVDYETRVWMYTSNIETSKEFINDVILSADRTAKRKEIQKSQEIIKTLKRDLDDAKNASIVTVFSERINSEYYNIAALNNELPHFVTYINTPRGDPYPVSPNILAILISNLIIFIFLGIGISFWQKNKDDIW